jgi:hypothetical protein
MSDDEQKPLNWQPDPDAGYSVSRRPDGGMYITFSDVSMATLRHWREFALEHLLEADRLTRNLYDLRQIETLPEEAVQYASEVISDPSVRNVRIAVVANEQVLQRIKEIAAVGLTPGGVELGAFTDLGQAEAWLDRPLTLLV